MSSNDLALKEREKQKDIFGGISRSLPTYNRFIERNIRARIAETEKALAEPVDDDRVLLHLSDPDVIAAIDDVEIAIVEASALADLLKLAEGRLRLAKQNVVQLISEREDVDPDGGWSVNRAHRVVLKQNDNDEEKTLSSILGICEALLQLDGETLEAIRTGMFPKDWKDTVESISGTAEFVSDLAEFLAESGEKGVTVVKSILGNLRIARRASVDTDVPKPVRTLASLAVKVRSERES